MNINNPPKGINRRINKSIKESVRFISLIEELISYCIPRLSSGRNTATATPTAEVDNIHPTSISIWNRIQPEVQPASNNIA